MAVDESVPPILGADQNTGFADAEGGLSAIICPSDSPDIPTIRLFGLSLRPQIQPGVPPSSCSMSADLIRQLSAILAPLQPVFTITDILASLIQCFLLAIQVLTNPLALRKLLGCIPGLVAKINGLLALIPSLPQGVVAYVQFVVDVISTAVSVLDCAIATLESIQTQIARIAEFTSAMNSNADASIRAQLAQQIECCNESVEKQFQSVIASLAPIARILCSVRAILSLIPGGSALADALKFPSPETLDSVDAAIEALSSLREVLRSAISLVESLAAAFGGLKSADAAFVCALDTASDAEPEVVAMPTIDAVFDLDGLIVSSIPAASSPDDDPSVLRISGTNFTPSSKVYFGTTAIETTGARATILDVSLPAELFVTPGRQYLTVVNAPSLAPSLFSGLTADLTPSDTPDVQVSELYPIDIL